MNNHNPWGIVLFTIIFSLFIYSQTSDSNSHKLEYSDDEITKMYQETHENLSLLSQEINFGMHCASYIKEFENCKNQIFKL